MQAVTLIIDTRREISIKYKKLIESSINHVLISKDLIAAMKIIQEKEPDIILISDSIDGDLADYCQKIRALTYNMRPIIIATSKSADFNDKIKVLDSGADDFISEPVNPEEFVMRIKAHLRRELETNMDAKRLLPGEKYSMRALKRLISDNREWSAMLVSIENFKNYKETYTELASDKLLQTYCAIILSTLSEGDYFGSISENQFLLITDRLKAEQVAKFLVFAFDSVVSKFYSEQDNKRGFMLMRGDDFAGRRSNFVHTTIGIVNNEFINYKTPEQLLHSLLQIHRMAELPDKSNYLIDRPRITAEDAISNSNKLICIIESDEASTLLINTILELQGYDVKVLDNYKELKGLYPALVILDAGNMDERKGLKICRKIRKKSYYNNTKIIVTSAFHDKELILSSGADLYMPKPYDIANLIKWVKILLND